MRSLPLVKVGLFSGGDYQCSVVQAYNGADSCQPIRCRHDTELKPTSPINAQMDKTVLTNKHRI